MFLPGNSKGCDTSIYLSIYLIVYLSISLSSFTNISGNVFCSIKYLNSFSLNCFVYSDLIVPIRRTFTRAQTHQENTGVFLLVSSGLLLYYTVAAEPYIFNALPKVAHCAQWVCVCVWTKAESQPYALYIDELMVQVSVKALRVNAAFINIVKSAWAELCNTVCEGYRVSFLY